MSRNWSWRRSSGGGVVVVAVLVVVGVVKGVTWKSTP